MSDVVSIRSLVTLGILVVAWCALWGEASVANVLSGVLIGLIVTGLGHRARQRGSIRPLPLARLAWIVLLDLVKSTVAVATEILTPTDRTEESIIGVELPPGGRDHLLLLTVAITLTPGTAVVDSDPHRNVLYVHLLHHDSRDELVEHVLELARLACDALPASPPMEVVS